MGFLFGASLLGLSTLFWIVAVIGFFVVTAYADAERFGRAIGILTIIGVALFFLAGISIGGAYHAIVDYPLRTLTYIGYFVGIGVIYGTIRWWIKIVRVRTKLIRYREREKIADGTRLTPKQREDFMTSIGEGYRTLPLRVSDNKARITFWMMFWPVSLPISLRPITRFFEFIYNQISGFLQSLSNRAFRDLA